MAGPNKRRAARKKKNKKKKKNAKASFSNHPAEEKVFAEAETVSEMVTCENEDNESSGSVDSFEASATEKDAADVVLSGSVSNVFMSETIAVGDVIAQPVFEVVLNEHEANESLESGDNQNTFQEVLIEGPSNKTERSKTCESVVNDEVKLQKSLIRTSKKAERYEPFESLDHQISLEKAVIGPTLLIKSTSNETEGIAGGDVGKSSCHPTILANLAESDVADSDQISPERALNGVSIKASSTIRPAEKKMAADVELFENVSNTSKYSVGDLHAEAVPEMSLIENAGSEPNESFSHKFLIKTLSNTVETNESSDSLVTDEVVLENTLAKTTLKKAEAYDPSKSVDEQIVLEEPLVVGDQNNLQESLIEPTISKSDITECGEMTLESALECLSLTSPAHPPHEPINDSSTVLLAGESVINDEVKLEESLIKTSKIAEAYDPSKYVDEKTVIEELLGEPFINKTEICKSLEFFSDQNNLQESLTEPTSSKADITECGETFSHEPTATASQDLSNVTSGDQNALECAIGGPSLEQQVHPLPEPPKRSRRNIKRPSWYDDFHWSPMVKPKRK